MLVEAKNEGMQTQAGEPQIPRSHSVVTVRDEHVTCDAGTY